MSSSFFDSHSIRITIKRTAINKKGFSALENRRKSIRGVFEAQKSE
jgi:hypothetical protein